MIENFKSALDNGMLVMYNNAKQKMMKFKKI